MELVYLSFKVPMSKEWTVFNDKIVVGDREILMADIQSAKLVSKGARFMGGVIQINVNDKIITLGFPNTDLENGRKAYEYIDNNCMHPSSINVDTRKNMDDIQNEINLLPVKNTYGSKKQIERLGDILEADEHIKAITSGSSGNTFWLIVCTEKRVLMVGKGVFYGTGLVDIPLDSINSVTHTKELLLGTISITDGAVTRKIDNVDKDTVEFVTDTIKREMDNYKQTKNTQVHTQVQVASGADELMKYKELLDMGVLTLEEFDIKKKEILGL